MRRLGSLLVQFVTHWTGIGRILPCHFANHRGRAAANAATHQHATGAHCWLDWIIGWPDGRFRHTHTQLLTRSDHRSGRISRDTGARISGDAFCYRRRPDPCRQYDPRRTFTLHRLCIAGYRLSSNDNGSRWSTSGPWTYPAIQIGQVRTNCPSAKQRPRRIG